MAGLTLASQLAQYTTATTPDVSGPGGADRDAVKRRYRPRTEHDGHADVLGISEPEHRETPSTVALFAGPTRLSPGVTRSLDNRMVLLTTTLPPDSTITVVATSGITDLSGNALTPFISTFTTTEAFDPSRASVITMRPTGSGVAPTTPITLFLNKAVNPSTVAGAIFVSQNGVLVTGAVSVDSTNQAIVFLPSVPFAASSSVDITLTAAVLDFDGNHVSAFQGSFTIAGDPTTTPPTLIRTSPTFASSQQSDHDGHRSRVQRADQSDHRHRRKCLRSRRSERAGSWARCRCAPGTA